MNRYAPDYFPSRKLAIPTQVRAGGDSQGGAALRREQAAFSAPLEAASYRFSCRSKKTAPGGTQLMNGPGSSGS